MQQMVRPIDLARGWPYFAALLLISVAAFWPTYFSPGLRASSIYVHLHAATAALWLALLIVQPWLVRTYRFDLHRVVGRSAFLLVPLMLLSMLLLANYRIRSIAPSDFRIQSYVLYLQFSLGLLFALCFAMAMAFRRNSEVHARFMVGTGLTLIDPVFARLFYFIHPASAEYHQWFTYALTDAVLVLLIIVERRSVSARWVFPVMLAVFALFQLPALLWLTDGFVWQSISRWFQSIPLT